MRLCTLQWLVNIVLWLVLRVSWTLLLAAFFISCVCRFVESYYIFRVRKSLKEDYQFLGQSDFLIKGNIVLIRIILGFWALNSNFLGTFSLCNTKWSNLLTGTSISSHLGCIISCHQGRWLAIELGERRFHQDGKCFSSYGLPGFCCVRHQFPHLRLQPLDWELGVSSVLCNVLFVVFRSL